MLLKKASELNMEPFFRKSQLFTQVFSKINTIANSENEQQISFEHENNLKLKKKIKPFLFQNISHLPIKHYPPSLMQDSISSTKEIKH